MVIESGELTFDPKTHTYTVDGVKKDTATEIITDAGLYGDKKYFTEYSRNRGSAVHEGIRLMLENRLDLKSVDPAIEFYLLGARRCIEDCRITPKLIEIPMYCEQYDYCGTPDLVASAMGLSDYCLIDWKSGVLNEPAERIQTILYQMLVEERFGGSLPIKKRMSIHITKTGKYTITSHILDVEDRVKAIEILKKRGEKK